jgi:hypothetical protein
VSNEHLPEHLRLNGAQEEALDQLGWTKPSPPEFPNWVTVHSTIDPPVHEVAERALATLRQVFGLEEDSPRRSQAGGAVSVKGQRTKGGTGNGARRTL